MDYLLFMSARVWIWWHTGADTEYMEDDWF